MKDKIYLAGRINGNARYKEEFGAAERFYKDRGFTVLNPALLPEEMDAADYARICAAMLDSADAVVMLPDWEMSLGARQEKAYAEYVSKPVLLHEEAETHPGTGRRSVADRIEALFMSDEFD